MKINMKDFALVTLFATTACLSVGFWKLTNETDAMRSKIAEHRQVIQFVVEDVVDHQAKLDTIADIFEMLFENMGDASNTSI